MSDEAPISFIPNTEHRSNDFTTIIFRSTLIKGVLLILGCLLILAGFVYWLIVSLNQPPADFPLKQPITIEKGTTVREITRILAEAHVVRSDAFLYYTLVLFYEPSSLKASTYLFSEPLSTTQVAKRLSEGDFDTDLIRFTHFEGERATQIAARASDILPNFNEARFIAAAEPLEGKLFPETYFVPEAFTDEDILNLMFKTFTASIEPLQQKVAESQLSIEEILILASIIEREANSVESKKMVSSVLQNRLKIGMALQADASIEYILEKPLSELTPDDLQIDSPYNTYLYPGLPPTPIGNPGLDAIIAVLEPTASDYFYYITDTEGVFHYAKTYEEHLLNIEQYLR